MCHVGVLTLRTTLLCCTAVVPSVAPVWQTARIADLKTRVCRPRDHQVLESSQPLRRVVPNAIVSQKSIASQLRDPRFYSSPISLS